MKCWKAVVPPGDMILVRTPRNCTGIGFPLLKWCSISRSFIITVNGSEGRPGGVPAHGTSDWSLFWLQLSRVSFPQIPGSRIVRQVSQSQGLPPLDCCQQGWEGCEGYRSGCFTFIFTSLLARQSRLTFHCGPLLLLSVDWLTTERSLEEDVLKRLI